MDRDDRRREAIRAALLGELLLAWAVTLGCVAVGAAIYALVWWVWR